MRLGMPTLKRILDQYPDPREDLESRSPNLGPYTTMGTLEEPPLRDLLFGSSRGVWVKVWVQGLAFRISAMMRVSDQSATLNPAKVNFWVYYKPISVALNVI